MYPKFSEEEDTYYKKLFQKFDIKIFDKMDSTTTALTPTEQLLQVLFDHGIAHKDARDR